MDTEEYHDAISHYTTTLSLSPPSLQGMLIKRSKAFLATGSRRCKPSTSFFSHEGQSLLTYHQVIMLDPSSPWGYEMKHAALHKAGDYDDAVVAFEAMLSKIAQSPDPDVQRELYARCHDKDDLFTLFDRAR